MFIQNKYTKWYYLIIDNAKAQDCESNDYYEIHHIIPKSLGGSNDKDNLVKLTARQHFVCHLLLLKMVHNDRHKRSMGYAMIAMSISNKGRRKQIISSREFELSRKIVAKYISGENNGYYGKGHLQSRDKNPMFGKPCYYKMSDEEKQKWKDSISKGVTGEKNPFYGKKHTIETRTHISKKRSIPIRVSFIDGTIVIFSQYKFLGTHLNRSEYLGCKLCKEENSHLLIKYGIRSIEKLKGNDYEKVENQIDYEV